MNPASSSPSTVSVERAGGKSASSAAWRLWAKNAPPELLERFEREQIYHMRGVRAGFPPNMHPNSQAYQMCRAAMVGALDALAHHIQEEHDESVDQDL